MISRREFLGTSLGAATALALTPELLRALQQSGGQLIQRAIEKLIAGRTSIVIAHRLSTIQKADKIAVMKKGKIVEQGTHEELITLNGTYNKLVNLQSFE